MYLSPGHFRDILKQVRCLNYKSLYTERARVLSMELAHAEKMTDIPLDVLSAAVAKELV
jgi:hypothetical protein